jgi:prolyl-tRNA synthetase
MSTLFLRTLREDPADAEVPSHKLLVRAGLVRRVAPGVFTWLPLGYLVYRNVERIVREEMDAAGFQEVHFPALLPREPYEATGRWTEYGETLMRLQDRKGADYLLGPTHEEMFTLLVKGEYSSYKDLPLVIYQIQTKYRDEARPRAGILRGREFVMKDSYSFDIDDEGLQRSYDRHRDAYIRTFDRLGLDYVIVSAMSGAMGGSASEEFLAPCESGEDTFVRSDGGYAANVEAVVTVPPAEIPIDGLPAAHVEDTPDTPTIELLVDLANARFPRADRAWTAADTLKNVVLRLEHPDGSTSALVVGLPGDREVDMKRLEAQVSPAMPAPFEEADFAAYPQLVKGYIGPQVLGRTAASPTSWIPGSSAAPRGSLGRTSRASTSSTWCVGGTSPRTRRSRPQRCATVIPHRTVPARCIPRAVSRSGTSSSSAASTPRRST